MARTAEEFVEQVVKFRTWVPRPWEWVWLTPQGTKQGFGLGMLPVDCPGVCNLWWLVDGLPSPPQIWNSSFNPALEFMISREAKPLADLAAKLTLEEFAMHIEPGIPAHLRGAYAQLRELAFRRLRSLRCQP